MASFNFPKYTPPPIIGEYTEPPITPADKPAAPPVFDEQGAWGDVGTGFGIGLSQLGGMVGDIGQGVGSKLLRALGANDLADTWDWESYQENLKDRVSIRSRERRVDIPTRVDDIDSVGGGFQWGMYTLAKQAPQLTGQFAVSLAASVMGGPVGAASAFLGTSYLLGAAEVYSEALSETGKPHLTAALAAGIPIAYLERFPFSKALRRMDKGADYGAYVGKQINSPKWKKAVVGSMELTAKEGTTEAFQNIIEQITVDYVAEKGIDIGRILSSQEFRESAAAGGVVGFALGPLAAFAGGASVTPPGPVLPPLVDKTTEEAKDALNGRESNPNRRRPGFKPVDPVTGQSLPADMPPELRTQLEAETLAARVDATGTRRPVVTDPLHVVRLTPTEQTTRSAEQALDTETDGSAAARTLRPYTPAGQESGAPIVRPGMPAEVLTAEEEIPRGKSREQSTLDKAYDTQKKVIEKLEKELAKTDDDATFSRVMDQLDVENLKLNVLAFETALQDKNEGGVGRTEDGRTLEQIVDYLGGATPAMGPAEMAGTTLLYSQVRQAIASGSISNAKRIMGMFEVQRAQRRTLRRVDREAKETAKVKEEARVAEETKATEAEERATGLKERLLALLSVPEEQLTATRLKEIRQELGLTKEDLGLSKLTVKREELLNALLNYVGEERIEQAATEREKAESDRKEALDERKDTIRDTAKKLAVKWKGVRTHDVDDFVKNIKENLGDEAVVIFNEAFNEQVELQRETKAVEEAVEEDTTTAEEERQLEDDQAELVRDTMENEDGTWMTPEEVEAREEGSFKALLKDLGLSTELSSEDAIKELKRIDMRSPVTKREVERLARVDARLKPLVAAVRRNIEDEGWRDTSFRKLLDEYEVDDSGIIHGPKGPVENEYLAKIIRRIKDRFYQAVAVSEGRGVQFELATLLSDWGLDRATGLSKGELEELSPYTWAFLSPQYITDPYSTESEAVSLPDDESLLWHKRMYMGVSEESIDKYVNQIVAFINGQAGIKGSFSIPLGLRAINENIRKANEKRQKKEPQLQLVDKKDSTPLAWDPQRRTSKQLIADIKKHISNITKEPKEIREVKEKIHARLIAKAEKEYKRKLTDDEKKDLTPIYASLNGRYILKPRKVEIKEGDFETSGWAVDKIVPPFIKEGRDRAIVTRKTATQKTGLMLAYDSKDQLMGVQEFDLNLSKMIMADLDYLRRKYNIVKGSTVNTWAGKDEKETAAIKSELVGIYLRYNLPMKGYIVIKKKGRTEVVYHSKENLQYISDAVESGDASVLYRDVPSHQLRFNNEDTAFGNAPAMEKVWVGELKDIPAVLRPFMSSNEKLGGFVFSDRTVPGRRRGREQEFAEAFATLTEDQQKSFLGGWRHQSQTMTIKVNGKDESLTGRITGFFPSIYKKAKPAEISAFIPAIDIVPTTDVPGEYRNWDKVEDEHIEFTDTDGKVWSFTKEEISSMDAVAQEVLDPKQTKLTNAEMVNEIESNVIHGRERDSSFLQRMSDPEVAVVDGVSYYLQPDSIEVGSKVYVREHLKMPEGAPLIGSWKRTQVPIGEVAPELAAKQGAIAYTVLEIENGLVTLDQLPGRQFKIGELTPFKFPVQDTRIPEEEHKIKGMGPLTQGQLWEIKRAELRRKEIAEGPFHEDITWDPSGTYILDTKDRKTTDRREKSLQPKNIKIGDAVRLSGAVIEKVKDPTTGQTSYILSKREGRKPVVILKEGFVPKPAQEFIIARQGRNFSYILADPLTGEELVQTPLSNVSTRSLNAKSVLENIEKKKVGEQVEPQRLEGPLYQPPFQMREVAVPDVTRRVPAQTEEAWEETVGKEIGPEGIQEASAEDLIKGFIKGGQFRAAPLRRWVNQYGVSIEEYEVNGQTYFEAYLPITYHQEGIVENFGERPTDESPYDALQRAMDKYGSPEFYENLSVGEWIRQQSRRKVREEKEVSDALSWTANGLTLAAGTRVHIKRIKDEYQKAFAEKEQRIGRLQLVEDVDVDDLYGEEYFEILALIEETERTLQRRAPGRTLTREEKSQLIRQHRAEPFHEVEILDPITSETKGSVRVRRLDRNEKGELIYGIDDVMEVPVRFIDVSLSPVSTVVATENSLRDLQAEYDERTEAEQIEQGIILQSTDVKQTPDFAYQDQQARFDSDTYFDENDPEIYHSLYHDESQYTDGAFPQRLIASTDEQGSTAKQLFNILGAMFGEGVFNTIEIVETQDSLPPNLNTSERVRAVAFNNKVWLVAENIPPGRVVPVLMHEIGAHGLRAIIGTKAYMSLLGEVAKLVVTDPAMRRAYNIASNAVSKTHKDANHWLVLEETMAYYVESNTPSRNTFWRSLLYYVLQGLHRLKFAFTSEMKGWQVMVLVRSAFDSHMIHMNGPDGNGSVYVANFLDMPLYQTDEDWGPPLSDPDQVAARAILGVNVIPPDAEPFLRETKGISSIFKINWAGKEAKKGSQLTFPSRLARRRPTPGRERFWIAPGPKLYRAIVDYFGVIEDYEAYIRSAGGTISREPSKVHGDYLLKVPAKKNEFRREFINPLIEYAKKHGVDTGDFSSYLYAVHAINVNNGKLAWKQKKTKTPPAGIFNTIAEAEANNSPFPSAEALMNEIKQRVGPEGLKHLEESAKYIYRMNDERLTMMRDAGLMPEWQIKKWLGLAHYDPTAKSGKGSQVKANLKQQAIASTYVPLRGDGTSLTWDLFQDKRGVTGLGVRGAESKKRVGRWSPAESPWAWSIQQINNSIDRIEKNEVDKAFAAMIVENQNLLSDYMMVVSDADMKFFKGRDPETKEAFLGLNPKTQRDPQHIVSFKQGGEQWNILVKDKRIGRAFNKTHVYEAGPATKFAGMVNRYLALMATSFSPEFITTNFTRDYQVAIGNLLHEAETRKGLSKARKATLAKEATTNIRKAMGGLHRFIRHGVYDTEWSIAAKEMTDNGGRIDFYAFKNAKHIEKKIGQLVKDGSFLGHKKYLRGLGDWVSDINASVENTMRLTSYVAVKKAMMENGLTETEAIQEAVDVSRNLTVNFSKRGELTPLLNSWYLFFNAGTLGAARLLTSYNKSRTFRKLVNGVTAGTLMISFYNYMFPGDDEDGENRYAKIPMSQRSRQLHIYVPGSDSFIKVPLGYGSNIPFVLGDTIMAVMMGQINVGEAMVHMMSSFVESFVPLDMAHSDSLLNTLAKSASPNIADPLVDLLANENWAGNPIYKEPYAGTASEAPAYRSWNSTSAPSKFVADWLNRISAGMSTWLPGGEKARMGTKHERGFISWDPTIFDYLFNTTTGGLGRFIKNTVSLDYPAMATWFPGGEPAKPIAVNRLTGGTQWNKIPFIRRFWLDYELTSKWDANERYTALKEEIGSAVIFAKGMADEFGVKSDEWKGFKESHHYDLAKLDKFRKTIDGRITKLYKLRAKIKRSKLMNDVVKEERSIKVENEILRLKRMFLSRVGKILGREIGLPFMKDAA